MNTERPMPPRLSSSQVGKIQSCPRAYAFEYLMKIPPSNKDAEYFIFGRAWHQVIQGDAAPDLVSLAGMDESKRDYRRDLSGLLEATRVALAAEGVEWAENSVQFPELSIKDENITIRIDGIIFKDGKWFLAEFKAWADRSEEGKETLRDEICRDLQLGSYLSAIDQIADQLFVDPADFGGVIYCVAWKPKAKTNPKYSATVLTLAPDELGGALVEWKHGYQMGRLLQEMVGHQFYHRNDPFDVASNKNSCRGKYDLCPYFAECHKRKSSMGCGGA